MLIIRRLLILLVVLSIWSTSYANNNKDIPITLGSPGWAVISEATGKVTESYPFVFVHLDHLSMRVNQDNYSSPIKVEQFRVGISHKTKDKGWGDVKWSDYHNVNENLLKGEIRSFDNLDMVVPIHGLYNLKDYWLTIEIRIARDGSIGSVYARSQKDIFEDRSLLQRIFRVLATNLNRWTLFNKGGEKIMGIVIGLSAVVSALAAILIGVFTALNYKIYKQLQKKQEEQQQKQEEQQQKFNDLLEAIVIATLVSNPNKGVWEDAKKSFLQGYKGETQIFKEGNKDKK